MTKDILNAILFHVNMQITQLIIRNFMRLLRPKSAVFLFISKTRGDVVVTTQSSIAIYSLTSIETNGLKAAPSTEILPGKEIVE